MTYYFSVRKPIRIAGKTYIPCICYEGTRFLERTIQELEKKGKACIYDHRVFFQSGRLLVKKDEKKEETAPSVAKKKAKEKKVVEETIVKETVVEEVEQATADEPVEMSKEEETVDIDEQLVDEVN